MTDFATVMISDRRPTLTGSITIFSLLLLVCRVQADDAVSFNRDVRPILADKCFHCHGPDPAHREADLRLDIETATHGTVIQPGSAAESEIIARVTSVDPDLRMPPPDSGKSIDDQQVAVLRRWIDAGAAYEAHWAFIPPTRPAIPDVANSKWVRNPIDAFVLAQLERDDWDPSPVAARTTLVRRAYLDLIGMPPTPAQVESFLADNSPSAWDTLIDRLLDSEAFGERMAMVWLDAARYSDTDGFQGDATRSNWPWRDWVVDAYNANLPFDQFTIQQFAGDLIEDANDNTVLATCFHRNHMSNGEGGRDAEESRIDYVIDRVNTVGTVWLGLTLGCSQCHSHKYDPISQAEYYALNAFFNSIDESGEAGSKADPFLEYPSPHVTPGRKAAEAIRDDYRQRLQQVEARASVDFPTWREEQVAKLTDGFRSWQPMRASSLSASHGGQLAQQADGVIVVTGHNARHDDYSVAARQPLPRVTGMRLEILPHASHTGGGLSLADDGHVILTNLKLSIRNPGQQTVREVAVEGAIASYEKGKSSAGDKSYGAVRDVLDDDPRTGWTTDGTDPRNKVTAQFSLAEPIILANDDELIVELRHRSLKGYANTRRFVISLTDERGPTLEQIGPSPLEQLASADPASEAAIEIRLLEQFLADRPDVRDARKQLQRAERQLAYYEKAQKPQRVTVLRDRPEPRETHVLLRGVWDKKGPVVPPGVPAALSPWSAELENNRLGLARWLVDRSNPLTARVTVNRFWQMFFGAGLVRTPDDFGAQGTPPTHPDLLDWLAVEFMDSGWNVKHVIKLIVHSATYRQSSGVDPARLKLDPNNERLARASRFRMPSWMIRDAALSSSGLLNARRGGPPVFPYQPEGSWLASTMGRFRYETSFGPDVHRRSLYTFWRRSVAPTMMFDAAKRRVCEVRTVRTNTPLHALTLMNDLAYVEASRALAEQAMQDADTLDDRLNHMFYAVLSRPARDQEKRLLAEQWRTAHEYYRRHPHDAEQLVSHGMHPRNDELDVVPLAAYTMVANTLLNLDEAITRE